MSDLRYWVGFNRVPRIGPVRLRLLLRHFGDLERAWHADAASLRAARLPQDALERLIYERGRLDLDAELARIKKAGVQVLTWESPDYPDLLNKTDDPPPVLYVLGDLSPADANAVAMVGTRHASTYGKQVARQLAMELAGNGITVVSGLALGIDGIAHNGALEAEGRTIAVLGCGLDVIYPATHRDLARRIRQSGALISDYCLGTRPEAVNFPPRNRIISGLSLGTIVVEAAERSGALITLQFALDQGREVFAVPGNVYSHTSQGTNLAIQRGHAKPVMRAEDVLEELHLTKVVQQEEVRQVTPDDPVEAQVLSYLGQEPTHVDELVRASHLPTATVSGTLTILELKGLVRQVGHMSFVLSH